MTFPFRDQTIAATLKRLQVAVSPFAALSFRDQTIAATLKRVGSLARWQRHAAFRDQTIAATLKRKSDAVSVRLGAPEADIVHDKFHVSKHLNEAVDQVRRQGGAALLAVALGLPSSRSG